MFLVRLLLPASIVVTVCFATFASGALELPGDEVQALRDIFTTLGKKDWNFADPCNNTVQSSTANVNVYAAVNCSNCFVNDINEPHRIVGIILKGQNLPGTLPLDLGKLPCLQVLDLSRNYLNGSIPSAWGSATHLVDISLFGNRVTGSIPGALANIKTLRNLTVAFNQLSGNLPPELGNMSSIETLLLSSNNFTGELPPSFAKLTSMQDLRISDLNGSDVTFPLKNISIPQWQTLILRNCNLTGPLPDQIFFPPGGRTEFTILLV